MTVVKWPWFNGPSSMDMVQRPWFNDHCSIHVAKWTLFNDFGSKAVIQWLCSMALVQWPWVCSENSYLWWKEPSRLTAKLSSIFTCPDRCHGHCLNVWNHRMSSIFQSNRVADFYEKKVDILSQTTTSKSPRWGLESSETCRGFINMLLCSF